MFLEQYAKIGRNIDESKERSSRFFTKIIYGHFFEKIFSYYKENME